MCEWDHWNNIGKNPAWYCSKFATSKTLQICVVCFIALSSHTDGISFADPANITKAQKELAIQIRTKAIQISNKYKIQIEPIQFEWDRFLPTLEKDFLEILNEMLKVTVVNNNQQIQTKNPHQTKRRKNTMEEYLKEQEHWQHWVLQQHNLNMANKFQHMLHSMPETTNTYSKNCHFTSQTYKGNQNRRHIYHTTPFRLSGTMHEQQGFHHRGSPRSSNWFYGTSPHDYYNNVFHNSNITVSNQETLPHARSTIYEGNLLSSFMIEWTIKQAALSSIETFKGTKSKFEVWTKSIQNAVQISGQNMICITFSILTDSTLWTPNRLKAW